MKTAMHARRRTDRGAALLLAVICILFLTIIGLALSLTTGTENQIAANESFANKSFYAADSGVEWAAANLQANLGFSGAAGGGNFNVPVNSSNMTDIKVTIPGPIFLGQAPAVGSTYGQWFENFYSIQSTASLINPNNTQDVASKIILAEVGVKPVQSNLGP